MRKRASDSGSGGAYFSASIHNTVISFFSKIGQIGTLGDVISFEITFCGNSSFLVFIKPFKCDKIKRMRKYQQSLDKKRKS